MKHRVRINFGDWKPQTSPNPSRLKEGIEKFREALEQDAKEVAARGSGLPKDWRNRILKALILVWLVAFGLLAMAPLTAEKAPTELEQGYGYGGQ